MTPASLYGAILGQRSTPQQEGIIGVFPQCQQILIGGSAGGPVTGLQERSRESKLGQRGGRAVQDQSAMLENDAKCCGSGDGLMLGQQRLAASVGSVHALAGREDAEIVVIGSLQRGDGLRIGSLVIGDASTENGNPV